MFFGKGLAEIYDLIYKDKDYKEECDFIEEIFRRFSPNPVRTILDGGCGTGGHAIPLVSRGYEVTGVDSSETMIEHAKEKAKKSNLSPDFQVGDLRRFSLNKEFDACICMFAVMGYITETEDILSTMENIRKHLNKEALFIFDLWNGLAVLRILPSERVKIVEDKERRVIRIAQPQLDAFNHLCRVDYRLLITENNFLIDDIEETHVVRYHFPREIAHYLQDSRFELLKVCPFLELSGKVDENVWNITVIAKAI